MEIKPPKLDDRTSETIFDQTVDLAKHYCPDWTEGWLKVPDKEQVNDDPGLVIFRLFSKTTEHLVNQMNRIPEKHSIAFLDFMGVDLLPAKPSRVPLTFYLAKKASGARIPQGTRIAARLTQEMIASKVPEVLFETDRDLDVVPVKMSAVYSLNPWEDKYTDHSKDVAGKEDGFIIFGRDTSEKPLDHILYMGDDVFFDISKETDLTIKIYGENLLSNYFETWFEGKDDGKKNPLSPVLTAEIENNKHLIKATFSKIKPIGKSSINNEESFWLSVKPASMVKIQNPFKWDEIPTEEKEKNRFLNFISWNFGEEWKNASIIKSPNDEIFISVVNPSGILIGISLLKIAEDKRELNYNNLKYVFLLKTKDGKRFLYHQPNISRITADVTVKGILPDLVFYNDTPLDVKKGFYPFGEIPKKLDTFYIGSEEAFSKKYSTITLDVKINKGTGTVLPTLSWEYWNGKEWSKWWYLFNWDDIPENESEKLKLKEYLTNRYNIFWVRNAEVIKSSDTEKIEVNDIVDVNNKVTLTLINENEVELRINNDSKETLKAKSEDSKLNIYNPLFNGITCKFENNGSISFICPEIELLEVNGKLNRWIRVRIEGGNYGELSKIEKDGVAGIITPLVLPTGCDKGKLIEKLNENGVTFLFHATEPTLDPPFITSLHIKYEYADHLIQRIKSYNNFQFEDIKNAENFEPYEPSPEKLPALYLGFDKDESLKGKPISIFYAIKEKLYKEAIISIENPESQINQITPEKVSGFIWEYYNGTEWEKFVPEDETDSFNKGGIVTFNINTNIAVKKEFEEDRYWIRVIPGVANKISCPKLKGIFPNSVWARNSTTVKDEILGSGNGQPGQTLYFSKKPVLKEQIIEVKEAGKPSDDEQKILRNELKVESEADVNPLREIKDEKTGEITETWVRWHQVDNFSLSSPLSRHYVIDRANGKIIFGDGKRGMLPPRGKKNINARNFNSGGSIWGNCKAGIVDQLKRKIPGIEKVTNHISASGGMDHENLEKAVIRGPHSLKNRDRAVTKEDFEWLAREASQDVAWAKCIPEMGKINIIIVPDSTDDKPLPEAGLLDEVKRYLEDRVLLTIRDRITTFGPDYKMINATVEFKPEKLSESAAVSESIKEKIRTFLHPVHGGQDEDGWDFGEKIFLSEVAAVIGKKGIKSINEITLEKFEYLFNWEDIPGNDNEKLKEYLTKKYNIDWVKDATIIKIDENNIEVSHGDNKVIELTLIDARTKLILTINGGEQTEKFIANPEKDKLNVFESKEIISGLGWITIEKDALPYAGHIEVIPEG